MEEEAWARFFFFFLAFQMSVLCTSEIKFSSASTFLLQCFLILEKRINFAL